MPTSSHLLLVDDDPEMRVIVAMLGRRAGLLVMGCPDVPSAWEELQQQRPDLLLVDINLPGASGAELCRMVRLAPALATLPIAVFGQWSMPQDIAAGLSAGAEFLLLKDLVCRPADWERRLREILTRAHGQPPARSLGYHPDGRSSPPAVDWLAILHRILRHPVLASIGFEVLRVILCRALEQVFPEDPIAGPIANGLLLGEFGLDSYRLPSPLPADTVADLFISVLDQLECLIGTDACVPIRQTLRDPGSTGHRTH
jgi:CheY-like chemotaxis protein